MQPSGGASHTFCKGAPQNDLVPVGKGTVTRRHVLMWLAVFSYVVLGLLIFFFPPKRNVKFLSIQMYQSFPFLFFRRKEYKFY